MTMTITMMNSSTPPPHIGTDQNNTPSINNPSAPITGSHVDASVDNSIYERHNEEDHDPIILTLPDPRRKATTSNDNNTASEENNEVDCQESTCDALDGTKDTLLN